MSKSRLAPTVNLSEFLLAMFDGRFSYPASIVALTLSLISYFRPPTMASRVSRRPASLPT